jgi:HK97 family phage major capsid protein
MTLSYIQKAALLKKVSARDQYLQSMQGIVEAGRLEKRKLSVDENSEMDRLEQKIKSLDDELEKHGVTEEGLKAAIEDREKRYQATLDPEAAKKAKTETRSVVPSEVRSYKKGERIGNGSDDVTIGDIILAHTTGRFRSENVRQLLTTNSGGVTISSEVFGSFIDLLRDQSFLGEFTVYNMDSKTLTIPKVTGDVVPHFKLEADPINLSSPIFEGAVLSSKFLYCLTEISLEMLESSAIDIGAAVNSILSKSMMASIQQYALTGDAAGYIGIVNDPDINTIEGDISYATIGQAIQEVQSVNGLVNSLLINPVDMMGLRLLTEAGGQFINPPSFLEDVDIIPTNSIAQGQALVGDLSTVAMGILSTNGLQLDISKDAGFNRGVVNVRARFSGDIILTDPRQLTLVRPVIV